MGGGPEESGKQSMRLAGEHRLSRVVGAAAGSTVALALLVCGCVFAAMAGPAVSLHTRSQALHQILAGLSSTTKIVQATANWGNFTGPLVDSGARPSPNLTESELAETTHEIGDGLAALRLPLGAGQWASLSTKLFVVSGAGPRAQAVLPPRLEVVYRDPLTSNAQLATGTYASAGVPHGMLAVAATTQMAARFGLHPGTRLSVATPSGPVGLFVTAILRERAPGSTFWAQDSTVGTPALNAGPGAFPHPYWAGSVFADPGQLAAMQDAFSGPGMDLNWEYPLAVGGVTADHAQDLANVLNRAATVTPPLTGPLAPSAGALAVSSPLTSVLSPFLATQAAIETVLLLLFVSLIVTGAAVILLAARMIVARRAGELIMLRARGGSLRQVAAVMARVAVLAAGPAAVLGAGLAIALIPGAAAPSSAGWPLAGIAVAAALAGPPAIAAWQYRKPSPVSNPARVLGAETGRPSRTWRRPVVEITACAAAAAALVVLHNQGLPAAGGANGTDLYLTITPVLVAIPVVVVMLRLYPLVVRGLLAASSRGAGATGFVAMSQAARSSLIGVLPAFALVLALSLATFAGMVNNGIARGEISASWHATGADVVIQTSPGSGPVSPAAVRAIAAVRGVRQATAVWNTTWVTPSGQPVTMTAVDPVGYAALVAGTPFPAFPATRIGTRPGGVLSLGATAPVLASPSAAALLGTGATQLSSQFPIGPVKVRVAGTLSSTPAYPGGGTFVIMPLETLPGQAGQPAPNMVLVTGSAIDDAQLSAVIGKWIPAGTVAFRAAALASLTGSPLQHGAGLIIALTIAAAAAFGLFIVILGLALGSAERELTLARLTVMGHERTTGLVMAETLPAVLAAVVAGAVCAVALPHLIGSSIDLSAFTGTSAPVQFQPDVLALALPAATIVLLTVAVLAAETKAARRHGVTGALRAH